MQRKCLLTKLYQYQLTILSFLNRFKTVWIGLKQNLAYRVPASKLTRRKITSRSKAEDLQGLDTTIDWKNTGDNSYDGEKLKLLVHDESGKWERPNNILNNWRLQKQHYD